MLITCRSFLDLRVDSPSVISIIDGRTLEHLDYTDGPANAWRITFQGKRFSLQPIANSSYVALKEL